MMMMSSAKRRTRFKSCVMYSRVMLRVCCRRESRSSICACTATSSAVVGSSAIRSSGSAATAIAIIALCLWPPESRNGYAAAFASGSPMPVSANSPTALAQACFLSKPRCRVSTSAICAPIVITGLSAVIGSWNTMPILLPRNCRKRRGAARKTSSPSKFRRPFKARSGLSRMMLCAKTVLPLPLSPTTAVLRPRRILQPMPDSTSRLPNAAVRFSTSRIYGSISPSLPARRKHGAAPRLSSPAVTT